METSLPQVFLKALAITPIRVVVTMLMVALGIITIPFLARYNPPEVTKLEALLYDVPYVEPETISMQWWIFFAIPLVGFIFARGFFYIRDDQDPMALVQLYLATILVFLPFVDQNVWYVGIPTTLLFILSLRFVQKALFKRKNSPEENPFSIAGWVTEHLEAVDEEKWFIPSNIKPIFINTLLELGWVHSESFRLNENIFLKFENEQDSLIISEMNQLPYMATSKEDILKDLNLKFIA